MYNPVGLRQLNAFTARARYRLPDVRAIAPPPAPAPADDPESRPVEP